MLDFSNYFMVLPITETSPEGVITNTPFCLKEPSAATLGIIYKRLTLFKDTEGFYPISIHRTIFVIACIHEYKNNTVGTSVCEHFLTAFIDKLKENNTIDDATYNTLSKMKSPDKAYKTLSDELFIEFINDCASTLPLNKVNSWYNLIDEKLIISDKKKEETKND